ncbi:flagellar biosynthetic protein FliO [Halorhodospira abdelmalekii]|uniref:flagellar biosynthetic protein FliO n=1 Tax=Halorhodospira abdelmalekii TaxID=421629 RepID=UPI0019033A3C|nr:flagellar biosynthetic protein FliO [Halorhodospira abdelmalekii]MBK1735677.1 flagellar biosynthetic protein FliO [Halorhodospira abdelmalekii]
MGALMRAAGSLPVLWGVWGVALLAGSALGCSPTAAWGDTGGAQGGVPGVEAAAIARVIVALVVIVALIIALAWMLRRYSGAGVAVSGQMRVLGTLAVGQRERVVLVQIGEAQLVLGVAPGRVQLLHFAEAPLVEERAAPEGRAASPFASRLQRLMQREDHS